MHSNAKSVQPSGVAYTQTKHSKVVQSCFMICLFFASAIIYFEAGLIIDPYKGEREFHYKNQIANVNYSAILLTPRPTPPQQSISVLKARIPRFLENYKNPCWREPKQCRPLIHKNSEYVDCVSQSERSGVASAESKLRCIPTFYVIGFTSSGAKDMMDRLNHHPDIQHRTDRLSMCRNDVLSFEKYFGEFDDEAKLTERYKKVQNHSSSGNTTSPYYHPALIGELNTRILHTNCEPMIKQEGNFSLPRDVSASYIYNVNPRAKIVLLLRNPTERLFLFYMRSPGRKSPWNFHNTVEDDIKTFKMCLRNFPLRHCLYNPKERNLLELPINYGIYVAYVADWYNVFDDPRQIMVIRTKDYAANVTGTLRRVFSFLDVQPLDEDELRAIGNVPVGSFGSLAQETLKKMLSRTKVLLDEFYKEYNDMLAMFLEDTRFNWRD